MEWNHNISFSRGAGDQSNGQKEVRRPCGSLSTLKRVLCQRVSCVFQLLGRPTWFTQIDVTVGNSLLWRDWISPLPETF